MDLTLGVRPGDDGTVVTVSGEVDVCTEAPLQQALLLARADEEDVGEMLGESPGALLAALDEVLSATCSW